MNVFKSVEVEGTYINRPVDNYTFSDLVEFIKENFDTWQTSPVIWDLTPSLLSKRSEPHDMIKGLLSDIKPLADLQYSITPILRYSILQKTIDFIKLYSDNKKYILFAKQLQ